MPSFLCIILDFCTERTVLRWHQQGNGISIEMPNDLRWQMPMRQAYTIKLQGVIS